MSSLLKLGIICTPEEYARSLQPEDPLLHCLTRNETIGLIVSTSFCVPISQISNLSEDEDGSRFLVFDRCLVCRLPCPGTLLVLQICLSIMQHAEVVLPAEHHLEN